MNTTQTKMRWYGNAAVSALLMTCGWVQGAAAASFSVASLHFEQNATDGDMEVVFQVKGAKDGLAELNVVSPAGRTIVTFKAPDISTLGIRQFRFESPEPTDIKLLKAAYPEGVYQFSGKTVSGATLSGESALSHRLPTPARVLMPAPKAVDVPARKSLRVAWGAVAGVVTYLVGIEQSDSDANFTATIPAPATSLVVPNGFLSHGKEYTLSIGTVGRDGNISFVETSFSTSKR